MSRLIVVAALILAACPAPAVRADENTLAKVAFEPVGATPVEVFIGQPLQVSSAVRNQGSTPLTISRVEVFPPGGEVRFDGAPIAPGGAGLIHVERPGFDRLGMQNLMLHIYSDAFATGFLPLTVPVFVGSAYMPEHAEVDFGYVRRGHAEPQAYEFQSFEADHLELLEVLDAPEWLAVRALPANGAGTQNLKLELSLTGAAPLGEQRRRVRLKTSVQAQPVVELFVAARVYDRIFAAPHQIDIAAIHQGDRFESTVELRSMDNRRLRVSRATDPDRVLSVSSRRCGKGCARLTVRHHATALRPLRGAIEVVIEGESEPVRIPYYGLVVKKGTRVRDLGVLGKDADANLEGRLGE